MSGPRSVRFESATEASLASFVARHPGLSLSSAAALLVEEGLRMDSHPGVVFREGPAGRRAIVAGGPDVWEIVRAVKLARQSKPKATPSQLLALVTENTGVAESMLELAIDYYTDYPDEVDALLADAERAEQEAQTAAERRSTLLGS